MKKIIIICLTGFISLILYGQDKIKLVPYDFQEKIKINRVKGSSANNENSDLIYSKNELNAISITVNPSDINKAEKSQLKIINLFDKEGILQATSQPLDLYDWIVIPMGDDNTVLVIFPAGTARKAIIKILKKSGNSLKEINKISRETTFFKIDISADGNYFVCGFSAFEEVSNKPEIKLYTRSGDLVWSNKIDEPRFYQVAISQKSIIGASKDSPNKKGFIYLYDYQGKRLLKDEINSHIGNYRIESSDYSNDRYFAISTINNIYLFDSEKKLKIKDFSIDNKREISSYILDKNGAIICAVMRKKYSQENKNFEFSDKELIIIDLQNKKRSIELVSDGEPMLYKRQNKAILKMSNNKNENYYEVQY